MLTRRDGLPLAGYRSEGDGPVLVLANGLGGPVTAFRHQLAHFQTRYRVLTWDYRGLYGSRSLPQPACVDVAAQADDLEDLMTAAGTAPCILIGWSMGVQVVLELAARCPERVSRIVLINGTPGRALGSTRLPRAELWLPGLLARVERHHRLGSRVLARLAESRTAAEWVRRLHLVSPRLATDELLDIAREFKTIDLEVYLRTLRALGEHDATRKLAHVTARALVMTGARDPVFPPGVARALAANLPRAELVVVPKATHYAPVEFPEVVNAHIDAFLARSGEVMLERRAQGHHEAHRGHR